MLSKWREVVKDGVTALCTWWRFCSDEHATPRTQRAPHSLLLHSIILLLLLFCVSIEDSFPSANSHARKREFLFDFQQFPSPGSAKYVLPL